MLHFHGQYYLLRNWNRIFSNLTSLQVISIWLLYECCFFLFLTASVIAARLIMLTAIIFSAVGLYVMVSLNQLQKMFRIKPRIHFGYRKLAFFMTNHTRLFRTLITFDKKFRVHFSHILFFQLLMSLYELRYVLTGENLKPTVQFIAIAVELFTFGNIFVLHFFCALFTKRLHQCGKELMHLHPNFRSFNSFRSKWKLSCYVEKFHTKKCYGFTYSGIGLITMFSFAKVGCSRLDK